MYFEIIGEITDVKTIAAGSSIREIARLRKTYVLGRWRKLKGRATIRLWMVQYVKLSYIGTRRMG
jgi:hypothetical protein